MICLASGLFICHAECRYAHYAEYRYAECRSLNVVILSFVAPIMDTITHFTVIINYFRIEMSISILFIVVGSFDA